MSRRCTLWHVEEKYESIFVCLCKWTVKAAESIQQLTWQRFCLPWHPSLLFCSCGFILNKFTILPLCYKLTLLPMDERRRRRRIVSKKTKFFILLFTFIASLLIFFSISYDFYFYFFYIIHVYFFFIYFFF